MVNDKQKTTISLSIVFVLFLLAFWVQDIVKAAEEKEVTITGELIDSSCYIKMGAKGMDHKECAINCAKAGIPLAILEDKTDKVYMLASDKEFQSASVKFQPLEKFVAQKVRVKGKIYEKGGQKLLEISSVEQVK